MLGISYRCGITLAVVCLVTAVSAPLLVGLYFKAKPIMHPRFDRVVEVTRGPLKVEASSGPYFVDRSGKGVYLTGSHTWNNFQDSGRTDPPPRFDFHEYVQFLSAHNHNFVRLWLWENASGAPWIASKYYIFPNAYRRTGPGLALDGKPKFDLNKLDDAFFDRLADRIEVLRKQGVYVSLMLFNGWSIEGKGLGKGNPWHGHPMNRANNINGVDADLDHNGEGTELHSLGSERLLELQRKYVQRIVETVSRYDNVLFEISNESRPDSLDWQESIAAYIRRLESRLPIQHPVGISAMWPGGKNSDLTNSSADWISPRGDQPALTMFRTTDVGKVVFLDSDHACGVCADTTWIWRSFLSRANILFMDPYDGQADGLGSPDWYDPERRMWEESRINMGYALDLAGQVDLGHLQDAGRDCSSEYCVASASDGTHIFYIAFVPAVSIVGIPLPYATKISVRVGPDPATVSCDWWGVHTGKLVRSDYRVKGSDMHAFQSPIWEDAVVRIAVKSEHAPSFNTEAP